MYVLYSISSAFSKKPVKKEAPAPAAAATPSEGMPSVESPEFAAFIESEAFLKLLESEESLKAMTE